MSRPARRGALGRGRERVRFEIGGGGDVGVWWEGRAKRRRVWRNRCGGGRRRLEAIVRWMVQEERERERVGI